jgi:subtilisin family serine protease
VYGTNLPWGAERIHAQCVWDNDLNGWVDNVSNAGQNVTIAVIDSGIDYINGTQKTYYPDLTNSVIGGTIQTRLIQEATLKFKT